MDNLTAGADLDKLRTERADPVDQIRDIIDEGGRDILSRITDLLLGQRDLARRAEPSASEDVLRFGIQVEKMLCAALGKEWSAAGISIKSLIAELAERRAKPSVAADERAMFEAWAKSKEPRTSFQKHPDLVGEYFNMFTQSRWVVWQARAALASPAVSQKASPEEPAAWMVGLDVFKTQTEAEENVRNPDLKPVPLYEAPAPVTQQAVSQMDGTAVGYEYRPRHENGMLLDWTTMPHVENDQEAADYCEPAGFEWRRVSSAATTASANQPKQMPWEPPIYIKQSERPEAMSYADAAQWCRDNGLNVPAEWSRAQAPSREAAPLGEYAPGQWWLASLEALWGHGQVDDDTRRAAKVACDFAATVFAQQGASHAANAGEVDDAVIRTIVAKAREFYLGYLSRHIPGDDIDAVRSPVTTDTVCRVIAFDLRAAIASSAAQEAK